MSDEDFAADVVKAFRERAVFPGAYERLVGVRGNSGRALAVLAEAAVGIAAQLEAHGSGLRDQGRDWAAKAREYKRLLDAEIARLRVMHETETGVGK